VNFLLDTNVCIALINGNSETVRKRFDHALAARNQLFVSSVAMFELWSGVFKSTRVQFNSDRLDAFLEGSVTILSFDEDDARAAGSLNAALKLSGQLIGSYDILIAGQAMHKNLTLVTANVSEFSRVKGLSWQDWARA
jgi:tRNA(fMet)-specific endonuclease VapC